MRIIPPLATHGARALAPFFPDVVWRIDESAKVAYLTFDDAPTRTMTRGLLDLLAAYDARATFFLIGGHAEAHPELVRALAAAGHTIGNHTFTHPFPWQTPAAALHAQLDRTTRLLQELTGRRVRFVRPPYGQINGALRTWCAAHDHRVVMWDVMPGDFMPHVDRAYVECHILHHTRPGSIIVLHDNPVVEDVMPAALETILRTLARDGWRFEAL